jgi:hypothetical protein
VSKQLRDRERIASGVSQSGAKRGLKIFPDQALDAGYSACGVKSLFHLPNA